MASKGSTKKTGEAAAGIGADPPEDAVARRAYEIFESGEGGSAQENWDRARREITSEQTEDYGAAGSETPE